MSCPHGAENADFCKNCQDEAVGREHRERSESNPEQTLADIEKAFEDSRQTRILAKNHFARAKARYRMTLVARRAAGERLTIPDMDALEELAIDDVPDVREAYLEYIASDSKYRDAKVRWEDAKRRYWDNKPERR